MIGFPRTGARADAIIVAYKSSSVIGACVRSLRDDPVADRIIVVNNSSGDGTQAAVQDISGVVYVESPENVGFGRAINSVRSKVQSDYVVLANPDTTQSEMTVSRSIEFLDQHSKAGLVGPLMLLPDGTLYRNSKRAPTLIRMMAERFQRPQWLQISRPAADHKKAHVTAAVIGSFVVCRRAALDSVNWFDEGIFLFGEDQDLCRRLRRSGWEVWYSPIGRVIHESGHSWRQLSTQGQEHYRVARHRELMAEGKPLAAAIYLKIERAQGLIRSLKASGR